MQELMLYAGQDSIYCEAAKNLEKFLRCTVDAKQIERLVHAYQADVDREVGQELNDSLPTASQSERTYVMMDGSMISTREPGWKEVKLGRIFAASNCLPANTGRNWIRSSYYIGLLGSQAEFLKKMEPAVDLLKDPVFVNDGAQWIWSWVHQYYPKATQILDFYHAVEYLNKFAQEQFKTREELEKWVSDQTESLLDNEIESVIGDIEQIHPRTKAATEAQSRILTYYRNNRHRMKYKTYREQGLMIGSGPIEAAHKTVIQNRMKKSGQRWTIDGANAIIQLRTVNMSEKWDRVIRAVKNAA